MPRVREDFHDLVELCFYQVRPDTGTDYPCTMRQLRDLRQLPAIRYPQPRSPYEACYTLVDFLRRDPIPGSKVDAALRRIGIALDLHDWGPDLIIKAFHDLDTAFFAANLAGMTTVNWFADSELCAMGHPSVFGVTEGPSKWPGPHEIYLNAHRIFRRGSAGHFSQMWGTVSITLITVA